MTASKPNHDAAGKSLVGQIVNYNAHTGDYVMLPNDPRRFHVMHTFPERVVLQHSGGQFTFTYKQLRSDGAYFADGPVGQP